MAQNRYVLPWLSFCLLLLSSRAPSGLAFSVTELNDPAPTRFSASESKQNWVLNPNDILNWESVHYINKLIAEIHNTTCAGKRLNMRVVAINKIEGSREDIDQFASDLLDKWQLGKHGIVIVIAIHNRKLSARIKADALSIVSSKEANSARVKIHHHLKNNRWDEGMRGLVKNYHTIVMSKAGPASSVGPLGAVFSTVLGGFILIVLICCEKQNGRKRNGNGNDFSNAYDDYDDNRNHYGNRNGNDDYDCDYDCDDGGDSCDF